MRSYASLATSRETVASLKPERPATIEQPVLLPSVPTTDEITAQLSRILESPTFAGLARSKSFLKYVVEQTLAGKGQKLKQYSIATSALGRDTAFDPELDPVVRLEAGKLRRALESYYVRDGGSDRVHISIPKGGYVPTFSLQVQKISESPGVATKIPQDTGRLLVVTPSGQFVT